MYNDIISSRRLVNLTVSWYYYRQDASQIKNFELVYNNNNNNDSSGGGKILS